MGAFTTIATGIGLATTAATTMGSFVQAGEQRRLKEEAERDAAKAMAEARKKLGVNYYEQLSIQKEPYELARRQALAQGAMTTEALKEGDERALAAGAGRVQLAQQAGQERIATAMQQEQAQLDRLVAGEDARLRDIGIQLDLGEVTGAQLAARDAEEASNLAISQGLVGVRNLGAQVAQLPKLYPKKPTGKTDSADASAAGADASGGMGALAGSVAGADAGSNTFNALSVLNPFLPYTLNPIQMSALQRRREEPSPIQSLKGIDPAVMQTAPLMENYYMNPMGYQIPTPTQSYQAPIYDPFVELSSSVIGFNPFNVNRRR